MTALQKDMAQLKDIMHTELGTKRRSETVHTLEDTADEVLMLLGRLKPRNKGENELGRFIRVILRACKDP